MEAYRSSTDRLRSDIAQILTTHSERLTPSIFFDLDRLDQQVDLWRHAMPGIEPHFAIKACDRLEILEHLRIRGISFDAANGGELELLHRLGVAGEQVVVTHPIRSEYDLKQIQRLRPRYVVVQSVADVERLAGVGLPNRSYSPVLLVRIALPYSNLNKFGVPCIVPVLNHDAPSAAFDHRPLEQIFVRAQQLASANHARFQGFGLSAHVGTNCSQPTYYEELFGAFRFFREQLGPRGNISLSYFDIGGGYCDERTAVGEGTTQLTLLRAIYASSQKFRNDLEEEVTIIAEPGRFMVADAAMSVTNVLSAEDHAFRRIGDQDVYEKHRVIHLDDGVYGSFMSQIPEGRLWNLTPLRLFGSQAWKDELIPATLWGPTCDSFDKLAVADSFRVPADLAAGDVFVSDCMGAYSTVTATEFNRAERPKVVLFSRDKSRPMIRYRVYSFAGDSIGDGTVSL